MTELLEKTPYLAKTHKIYTQFSTSERRREYALARMKADLDLASQREYSYDAGRAEGRAEGEIKAKQDSLLTVLKVFYPEQFAKSVQDRILQITDTTRLEDLFQGAISRRPFDELLKML